jgi:hypothetical protein
MNRSPVAAGCQDMTFFPDVPQALWYNKDDLDERVRAPLARVTRARRQRGR